jgi:predicted ATPase/DNA-binding XRE family transcriptional regulator
VLLRQHRVAACLTQAALAERAGISERAVQHLERGLGQPQRETMRRLAEVFALTGEDQAAFEAAAQPAPRRGGQLARGRGAYPGRQPLHQDNAGLLSGRAQESAPPSPLIRNLPAEVSSLIGREEELAQLTRRLATTRLLTLVGPGGVGKTRLAVALAAARAGDYADGVVFIDLSPLRDSRLVPATIAHALKVRESGGRSARELLLADLRARRLLLVLDNFEHLLGAAPLVAELLQACPQVAVLATSRTALRLRGEQRFAVLPLATPSAEAEVADQDLVAWPAVRLFLERARAVAADFALTPGNAPAIAGICRRLDGLPLALELAAARVPLLPPDALLRRLDRRLSVLTGGAADLPERQQTLRNTLAWSHDLLAAADRLLFQRLAVFAGGWTLEAAEAVCADGDLPAHEVLDRLQSLVDHSLVRRLGEAGDEPRFGMLGTIREYAVEQLEAAAEAGIMRGRHLTWCLALAESADSELRGPRQQHVLTRLELEHDNLRSALSWSLLRPATDPVDPEAALRLGGALARFWSARGFVAEGSAWLERAVEAANAVSPPLSTPGATAARAKALLGLGWLCAAHGDFDRALEHDVESLALYRRLGDRRGMAGPLLAMAHLADYQGKSAQVRALLMESIEHARAGSDDNQVGEALCWLARALYQSGELTPARAALEESATLLRRTGDVARLAGTLFVQGLIEAEQGDHSAAVAALARSSDLYRQAGDRIGETRAIGWLGYAALHAGNHPAAWTYLSTCVERGRQDGLNELAKWLCLLARLERAEGRSDDAWTRTCESLALYRRMGCPAPAVRVLEVACGLLAATGVPRNVELAARLFGAADARRNGGGLPLPPAERADYERDVALVRGQLPGDVIARAWKQGQAMSLDQAVAEALAAYPTPEDTGP